MRKIFSVLTAAIMLFAASCTITQDYHFNSDMSGTAKTQIDMSALLEFMNGMDSVGDGGNALDTLDEAFITAAETYREAGAKNVQYGWNDDSTVMFISYDFDNVDVLNNVLVADTESDLFGTSAAPGGEKAKFTVKGNKKLEYTAPTVSDDSLSKSEDLESMKDYYQYKLSFSFDREIKKLKNDNAVMNPDGKSFEFSGSLFDIMLSPDYSTSFKVKLK